MTSFIYYCDYCNAKLNVAGNLNNTDIVCPVCQKKITPSTTEQWGNSDMPDAPADPDMPDMPDMPDAPAAVKQPDKPAEKPQIKTPEKASEKYGKRIIRKIKPATGDKKTEAAKTAAAGSPIEKNTSYTLGRYYCIFARMLAAVVFLSGIILTIKNVAEYWRDVKNLPEREIIKYENEKFSRAEKLLVKLFSDAVIMLPAAAGGLALDESVTANPDLMSGNIELPDRQANARRTITLYREKITTLKDAFRKKFAGLIVPDAKVVIKISAAPSGIITIKTGESNPAFYDNLFMKNQQLDALDNWVKNAQSTVGNDPEVKGLLKHLSEASVFIRRQLVKGGVAELATTVKHKTSENSNAQGAVPQTQAAQNAFSIDFILENWRLDSHLKSMENILDSIKVYAVKFERERDKLYKKLTDKLMDIWIDTVLAAFILLVLAEALRALLDIADIQRRNQKSC